MVEETNLIVASYTAARGLVRKLSIWSLRPGWLKVSDFFSWYKVRVVCCCDSKGGAQDPLTLEREMKV